MTPNVNQHTVPPTGNMPRNRQTYILLGQRATRAAAHIDRRTLWGIP
jgi:hypothetical protein